MKILHLMLSNFYIDNAGYQENIVPRINKRDGHEVEIIASTEVFMEKNQMGLIKPSTYINEDGIKVTRLPYKKNINKFIARKTRDYPGLYDKIKEFNPDIILFHGAAALAINVVSKYKKDNPQVSFFIDSHEDSNNSARNFLSRFLLYDCFYSPILRKNIEYVDKLLYITKETYNFCRKVYKIDDEKLFFFPLGGIVPKDSDRITQRVKLRKELGLKEDDILCIHTGKMDKNKRSLEIIQGFSNYKNDKFKLIIIGNVEDEIREKMDTDIAKDSRIQFLGWKASNILQHYLMAGDLYIQLGGQSVSMQQSLCNGCAVALFPYESHTFLLKENAYYIQSSDDISNLLKDIAKDLNRFKEKREKCFNFAKKNLDYNVISNIIINWKNDNK